MAATYITIQDLTNAHLRQFPDAVLQPFIDEANAHYEDIAFEFGVQESMIHTPISTISMRYLKAYVVCIFAESSIGANNVTVTDEDMYKGMLDIYEPICAAQKKKLTAEIITNLAFSNPKARSVQTGRLFRVS